MKKTRRQFIRNTAITAASACLSTEIALAFDQRGPIAVELHPATVIREKFLGFGAEWDSNAYTLSGVTDEDFERIVNRVEWMKLPIVRMMILTQWCYKGKDRYDWDDPHMMWLYRQLDVCQRLGITVLLTDWGIETWAKIPDAAKMDEPKYAKIIAHYMDHLVIKKGYTCIQYFVVGNEPNLECKDIERWIKAVENVSDEFHQTGLSDRITLMGPDAAEAENWVKVSVDKLQNRLGAYDLHSYPSEAKLRDGTTRNLLRDNWKYALAKDPKAGQKPLILSEAGIFADGFSASNNSLNLDPKYGVLMCDYAVQAANAGTWAILAWMLDDNSHVDFSWGMWKAHKDGMAHKPWFYAWSLLCRIFRPGMSIVHATSNSLEVKVLAAHDKQKSSSPGERWAFCIVNNADTPKTVRLHLTKGPRLSMERYVYSSTSAQADSNGFPIPVDVAEIDLGKGAEFDCAAHSVLFLSAKDQVSH